VAPITNIRRDTTNNERQREHRNVLHSLNIFNNTSASPSIDKGKSGNVSVVVGENAYLVCSVMDIGRHYVSWLRHSDINLLSVGDYMYSQDNRYQIFHKQHNNTWTLKVTHPIRHQIKRD